MVGSALFKNAKIITHEQEDVVVKKGTKDDDLFHPLKGTII
jgi:hypothetical protein